MKSLVLALLVLSLSFSAYAGEFAPRPTKYPMVGRADLRVGDTVSFVLSSTGEIVSGTITDAGDISFTVKTESGSRSFCRRDVQDKEPKNPASDPDPAQVQATAKSTPVVALASVAALAEYVDKSIKAKAESAAEYIIVVDAIKQEPWFAIEEKYEVNIVKGLPWSKNKDQKNFYKAQAEFYNSYGISYKINENGEPRHIEYTWDNDGKRHSTGAWLKVCSIQSSGSARLSAAVKALTESGDPAAEPYVLEFAPMSYWEYLRYRQDAEGRQKRLEFLQMAAEVNALLEKHDLCMTRTAASQCKALNRSEPGDDPGGKFNEAVQKQWAEFNKGLAATALSKFYNGKIDGGWAADMLTWFGTEFAPSEEKVNKYNAKRMNYLKTGKMQ